MSAILMAVVGRYGSVQAWTSSSLTSRTSLLRQRTISSAFGISSSSPFHHQRPLTRCFAGKSSSSSFRGKKGPQSKKKIVVNQKISQEQASANLAAAFDQLAKTEGFGKTTASQTFFANDSTFEDEFDDDDFVDDEEEFIELEGDGDGEDDDASPPDANYWGDEGDESVEDGDQALDDDGGPVVGQAQKTEATMEARVAALQPVKGSKEVDMDYLDFGPDDDEEDDDMDARIAAAQQDMARGKVTVDSGLGEITKEDMKRLGFKQELNPFEGDNNTPRQEDFQLVTEPMTCSACGADFQGRNASRPGYLPPEKYDIQQKLAHIQELQILKGKAQTADWTPDDEVEWLLRTSGGTEDDPNQDVGDIDIDAVAEGMGVDLGAELMKTKKVICKRCHQLQNFGQVEEALRPGWTDEPLMSQQKFRDLLKPISAKTAVVIAIVDLFDFSGSVLPELDAIAGDNPVILAANKGDLLPPKMGQTRAENWVRRELEYLGVQSIANIGGAVRLISCKTGMGINGMLSKARKLAEEMDCDVYVVGAANAGKSTLMNYILRGQEEDKDKFKRKKRAGNENARKGALTTSPLPGTTLKFIKVDLGGGRSIYDTPGLLVPGTLTQLLTPEELKIVVPNKRVEPISFRVVNGKCVQVGGLARISVIGDSKPFLFTFFVANQIKLHLTDQSRADEFVAKHAGGILTPPLEPGPERMEQLGEFETHVVEINGESWKEAAADITLTGLGWVAVTGPGTCTVEIKVPKGIGVQVRPPLMPYDMWEVAAKYTGSKAIRKSGKSVTGKRRKGVGRN